MIEGLCQTPWVDLGGWDQNVKIQLFRNMIMSHIKLKGNMNAATWPRSPHDAHQIKGKHECSNMAPLDPIP